MQLSFWSNRKTSCSNKEGTVLTVFLGELKGQIDSLGFKEAYLLTHILSRPYCTVFVRAGGSVVALKLKF